VRPSALWKLMWAAPLCLALAQPAAAQAPVAAGPVDAATALPFGECALGQWSSGRNLDEQGQVTGATCQVTFKPRLGANLQVGLNARAGVHDQGAAKGSSRRMREAYLDFDAGPLSLRMGHQIVAWGRADRINPTDSLSPRDFTLLTPDDEQQRNGIDALQARYAFRAGWVLTAVVAQHAANVAPTGSLPANLVPAAQASAAQWAVKLDRTGGVVDGSVSYFEGHERSARFWLDVRDPDAPIFRADFERVKRLGADFAVAQGAWTFRGEWAHALLRPACDVCPGYERRVSSVVLGADVDFAQTMNFNVQWFGNRKGDFDDPRTLSGLRQTLALGLNRLNADYGRRESGFTVRLSDRLLNDKLRWEISAVIDQTGNSHVIRPRLTYAVNDQFKFTAGLDHFGGPAQSYFGALDKNNTLFALVSWIF
jgi:hypothetical protein